MLFVTSAIATSNKCLTSSNKKLLGSATLLVTSALTRSNRDAISKQVHATSNKCLTSSNKKLLGTSATLLGTSALLVVTRSY